MARLNNRRTINNARDSSQASSPSPAPTDITNTSEQENRDPRAGHRDKGKGRATDAPVPRPSQMLTPTSDESETARGQKRKRDQQGTQLEVPDESERFTRYFDPNQDPEIRRQVKRKSRALEREFNENRDELLRGDTEGLNQTINRANHVFKNVKQTNDATLDSRLMVNVSDLAYKRSAQLVLGDKSSGIDVDEFLSKCIFFMRNGGPGAGEEGATQTQRRRTQRRNDDDDEDEEDEDDVMGGDLDWELLGRHACFPYNSRPPCPSFLLGPLSVEKKLRKQTQRSARQTKDTSKETRPEALTREDLSQSDENGLTAVCTRIRKHLMGHIRQKSELLQQEFSSREEIVNTPRGKAFTRKHKITADGGVILFDYVLNAKSFGQTVENMFYISFLIKEGHVGIQSDENGMPALGVVNQTAEEREEHAKSKDVKRHQAVFSLDWGTWQKLVKAFDVREPMIPHRQEEPATQVGERGWYA